MAVIIKAKVIRVFLTTETIRIDYNCIHIHIYNDVFGKDVVFKMKDEIGIVMHVSKPLRFLIMTSRISPF